MTVARYTDAYKAPGKTLKLAAPHAVTAGAGAKVGAIFGVAKETLGNGDEGEFETEGEFNLTKVGSQAWAKGERIYWDVGNTRCTSDSAAGMFIGCATEVCASGAGDTTGTLKLSGASEQFEGAQAAIVTLTDSTGADGTHDDTLADGLNSSAPAAYSAVVDMTNPVTKTEGEAVSAALASLRGTVATMQSDAVILNQNTSDLAQKVIEILARLVAAGLIDA